MTYRNENLDSTRHQGAEATFSYLWEKRVKIYGSFTYHRATFEAGPFSGRELPLVPNRTVRMGAEWHLPGSFMLRPEARFVSNSYLSGDLDNNGEKLSAYQVYNLFLFYRPEWGRYKVSAFAAIENLKDEMFAMTGVEGTAFSPQAYYPMPGRTFKLGISFEF